MLKIFKESVNTWSVSSKTITKKTIDNYGKKLVHTNNEKAGLFGISNTNSGRKLQHLNEQMIIDANCLLAEATDNNRTRKMVQIIDDLSDTVTRTSDVVKFISTTHHDEYIKTAAQIIYQNVNEKITKLNIDQRLYNAVEKITEAGDIQSTTNIDDYVLQLYVNNCKKSGALLSDESKETIIKLQNIISENSMAMMNGFYILPNGKRKNERKFEVVVQKLLNSRHKLAEICGFSNYANMAVEGSALGSLDVVHNFINILNDNLKDTATKQQKVARKYVTDDINLDNYKPYFSLDNCWEGLNILVESLFGIKLVPVTIARGETLSPTVKKYEVICQNEGLLGYIYCDFFANINDVKPNQGCCYHTIRKGRLLSDGTYQNPIVAVSLNLPRRDENDPCLLSYELVDSLFHTMGYALHAMLSKTQYQYIHGTKCSRDISEIPSALMLNFSNDPRIIKLFAKHYQTREAIPDNLLNKYCAIRNIVPAASLQEHIFFSMLDQNYHSKILDESSYDVVKKVHENYGIKNDQSLKYCQMHSPEIAEYGATSYSYLSSKAIASWIWQMYFQDDPLNRTAGDKYRYEFLAHGNGKISSKLVTDFVKQDITAENLAKTLIDDIKNNEDQIQYIEALKI
ncbi:mitochondrial intermediate peptidase-like [Aphidius gifuensis]|uniref:mitochondrial intermediate peptidase-like n=1 Tax=Aphidius gifuensis TaxID=684658 RepID=UPI001CDD224D|nr:mitochondrial intermediate peptidase-like [Aphidius gifuensis]